MNYPHKKGTSRKFFLVLDNSKLFLEGKRSKPWCVLCWPYVDATCCLHQNSESSNLENTEYPKSLKVHVDFASTLLRVVKRYRKLLWEGKNAEDASAHLFKDCSAKMGMLKMFVGFKLFEELYGFSAEDIPSRGRRKLSDGAKNQNDSGEIDAELQPPKQVVHENIERVLEVLHSAPGEAWTSPPKKLEALRRKVNFQNFIFFSLRSVDSTFIVLASCLLVVQAVEVN